MKVKIVKKKSPDLLGNIDIMEFMTQKEKDGLFPGWEGLNRLSKGILEEEEDDDAYTSSTKTSNNQDITEDEESSDKIVLNRRSFDLLMKRIADDYEKHLQGNLNIDEQDDPRKAKIHALCNRYGYKTFRSFLKIINAWELAQKGNLNKPAK